MYSPYDVNDGNVDTEYQTKWLQVFYSTKSFIIYTRIYISN